MGTCSLGPSWWGGGAILSSFTRASTPPLVKPLLRSPPSGSTPASSVCGSPSERKACPRSSRCRQARSRSYILTSVRMTSPVGTHSTLLWSTPGGPGGPCRALDQRQTGRAGRIAQSVRGGSSKDVSSEVIVPTGGVGALPCPLGWSGEQFRSFLPDVPDGATKRDRCH